MTSLLEIQNLTVRFGGLVALNKVSLAVEKGSIFGLIGPNGAGKSTLLNTITGICPAESGSVNFDGKPIEKLKPHVIAGLGIARTFQTLGLFHKMKVIENLLVGLHTRMTGNVFSGSFMLPSVKAEERKGINRVLDVLASFGLKDAAFKKPEDLPFGHCKLLELARAILSEPHLLLLDEPTSGLSAEESTMVVEAVRRIRRERPITLLIIEHNIPFIRSISDRIAVLNFGEKIAEGEPEDVMSSPVVIEAYLGDQSGFAENL